VMRVIIKLLLLFLNSYLLMFVVLHCMTVKRIRVGFRLSLERRVGKGRIMEENGRWWKCCGGIIEKVKIH